MPKFTPNVDVGSLGPHGEADHQRPLDQFMRIASQNLSILASARLRLVRVDDQVARPLLGGHLRHEGVFQSRGETGATATPEPRELNLIDDPIGPIGDDVLGAVPVALSE